MQNASSLHLPQAGVCGRQVSCKCTFETHVLPQLHVLLTFTTICHTPLGLCYSFIRHLMEAVGLLLTSDYEFGAMLPAGRMAQCQGQGQFEEKVCRNFVNNMVSACNGTVVLHLDSGAWPRLGPQHTHYDAVIWGAGRHPLYGDYKTRYGVHNASAVIRDVFKPFCQDRQGSTRVQHKQALFWVQSHARLTPGQPDEQPQLIRHFNEDVCSYLGE